MKEQASVSIVVCEQVSRGFLSPEGSGTCSDQVSNIACHDEAWLLAGELGG